MMIYLLLGALMGGGVMVFSSRSPYFGMFGVLLQSVTFSVFFCLLGFPLFGLLTMLIYVGGMLIMFLFSTILSAERYPDSGWKEMLGSWMVLWLLSIPIVNTWDLKMNSFSSVVLASEKSLGEVFSSFGVLTLLVVFVLLVALMVVLAFGYAHSEGSLRKL